MKLGVSFPEKWKEKSEKNNIPVSDILYGYAVEDLMMRIVKSSFQEFLWITNWEALGEEAYKKNTKESLEFLYVESEKKIYQTAPVAGQPFSQDVLSVLVSELFSTKDETDVQWTCNAGIIEKGAYLLLNASYLDMQVPITMKIEVAHLTTEHPKSREIPFLFEQKKSCAILSYSKESSLSEALFEIMRKLELISDMESYNIANEIIKTQSISGRHIIGDFKTMGEKEPKVVSMKRMEQIETYKSYTYMKKKWQKYVRTHNPEADEWEVVIERIISFVGPLWKALCENEIFFDDWMPELGRFLG